VINATRVERRGSLVLVMALVLVLVLVLVLDPEHLP
jgi:hypothetical protein